MSYKKLAIFILLAVFIAPINSINAQEKFGPTPNAQQLAWHEKEFYLFIFTDSGLS